MLTPVALVLVIVSLVLLGAQDDAAIDWLLYGDCKLGSAYVTQERRLEAQRLIYEAGGDS